MGMHPGREPWRLVLPTGKRIDHDAPGVAFGELRAVDRIGYGWEVLAANHDRLETLGAHDRPIPILGAW